MHAPYIAYIEKSSVCMFWGVCSNRVFWAIEFQNMPDTKTIPNCIFLDAVVRTQTRRILMACVVPSSCLWASGVLQDLMSGNTWEPIEP